MNDADRPLSVLGGLSAHEFLTEYWQKKPLFVKGAIPNFIDPITADEIAGLACESFIPSRLVLEEAGVRPWELRSGPFDELLFSTLPKEKWMLIINDLEKFLPELTCLTEPFSFIPSWRRDDLQVSIGDDQGSVGAHWDDYDVFLLQGLGKKHWKISFDPVSEDDFVAGIDIRLIENLKTDAEWIVEPGDLLYLPPRIGHYGINIGRSVTWSIGFRAPKYIDMVQDFTAMIIDKVDRDLRFSDPSLRYQMHKGELSEHSLQNVTDILREALALDSAEIANWFGEYITAPKLHQEAIPLEEEYSLLELEEALETEGVLERHPGLTFIFREEGETIFLYVGGEIFPYPVTEAPLIKLMCAKRHYDLDSITANIQDRQVGFKIILDLLNLGYLNMYNDNFDEEDEEYEE